MALPPAMPKGLPSGSKLQRMAAAASTPGIQIGRIGWGAGVLLALGLFMASLPFRYQQLLDLQSSRRSEADILRTSDPAAVRDALTQLGIPTTVYAAYNVTLEVVFAAVFVTVGVLIFRRRSQPWFSMLVSLTLVLFGTAALPTMDALASVQPTLHFLGSYLAVVGWTIFGVLYFLFPNGRIVPRGAIPLILVWLSWQLIWGLFPSAPFSPYTWPPALAFVVWVGWFGTGALAMAYRYARISNATERQQTRWVVFGMVVAVLVSFLVNAPNVLGPIFDRSNNLGPLYELARIPLVYLTLLVVPLAFGAAILRYRLWEIDVLINRTLVYLPLTAILGGLFTAGVSLGQRVFVAVTGNNSDIAIVVTTLIVASTFTPIRSGLQSSADRWFKDPPNPDRRMMRWREQMQNVVQVLDVEQLARHTIEEVKTAFDAECGALFYSRDETSNAFVACDEWNDEHETMSVSLTSNGDQYGRLALGPRRDGRPYTDSDRAALEKLASPMIDAMRLAERLR